MLQRSGVEGTTGASNYGKYMPKKSANLVTAYCLLATVSGSILLWDACRRRDFRRTQSRHHELSARAADNPLLITPIAASTFPRLPNTASETDIEPEADTPVTTGNFSQNNPAHSGGSFLKVPIKTETASGPKSFGAGTRVQILRRHQDKVEVTHDGADFSVQDWQITSDPKVGGRPTHSSS